MLALFLRICIFPIEISSKRKKNVIVKKMYNYQNNLAFKHFLVLTICLIYELRYYTPNSQKFRDRIFHV